MGRKRKQVFSVVKAVKANARIKVGQPKPVRMFAAKPVPGAPEKYKTLLLKALHAD